MEGNVGEAEEEAGGMSRRGRGLHLLQKKIRGATSVVQIANLYLYVPVYTLLFLRNNRPVIKSPGLSVVDNDPEGADGSGDETGGGGGAGNANRNPLLSTSHFKSPVCECHCNCPALVCPVGKAAGVAPSAGDNGGLRGFPNGRLSSLHPVVLNVAPASGPATARPDPMHVLLGIIGTIILRR